MILPEIGQEVARSEPMRHCRPVPPRSHAELVSHLVRSSPLDEGEADRVLAEVLDWFAEPVPDFVRRRHGELAARGFTNDRIFAAIAGELPERRFSPPSLTIRQLRRLVYGCQAVLGPEVLGRTQVGKQAILLFRGVFPGHQRVDAIQPHVKILAAGVPEYL